MGKPIRTQEKKSAKKTSQKVKKTITKKCCKTKAIKCSKDTKTQKKNQNSKIKSRDVEITYQTARAEIPEHLFEIKEANLLESLLYPVTLGSFFENIYKKKALVIAN